MDHISIRNTKAEVIMMRTTNSTTALNNHSLIFFLVDFLIGDHRGHLEGSFSLSKKPFHPSSFFSIGMGTPYNLLDGRRTR